jgi:hypothetical protein
LLFNIGCGSTLQTAAGVWTAGSFNSAPGTVNITATNNGTFGITGVALMVGAAAQNAEPEFKKYSDNLIDCQRYYTRIEIFGGGYNVATGNIFFSGYFPATMRATPTLALLGNASSNLGAITSVALSSLNGAYAYGAITSAGTGILDVTISADADF